MLEDSRKGVLEILSSGAKLIVGVTKWVGDGRSRGYKRGTFPPLSKGASVPHNTIQYSTTV